MTAYAKGLSPLQSQHRKGAYTEAEQKMMNTLNFYGIDYRTQITFKREAQNPRGQELTYTVDFILNHNIILEIEGDGSSSKGNEERDAFFKKLDYTVIHIPNEVAMKYSWLLAQFLALIVGSSRPEKLGLK